MVIGLLFSLLPLLLVFVLVRAISGRGKGAIGGHPVRHFFQYLLLYGLMVVVAVGLSGLLGLAIESGTTIVRSETALARGLAFVIVGIPLLAIIANWTRRGFAANPQEREAFAWGIYLTFAGITSLVMAMQALQESLQWATGNANASRVALAGALVWGATWGGHWWLDRRFTSPGQTKLHHVIGSVIALVWAGTGLGMVIAATLRAVLPFDVEKIVLTGGNAILNGAATLVVGAIAWYVYWVRTYGRSVRDALWDVYVMVAGVAGGLITAVSAASVFLYTVLVWFFGSTTTSDAAQHFRSAPASAAALLVGLLVWWYHRAVLAEIARSGRTEGQRIYEYLVGAIGLLAAAAGLTVLVTALLETVTAGSAIAGAGGPRNTLLLATTLLLVGTPVWWIYWHRIEDAVAADRATECASPTRRIYLFMLFGIGGTAAVIALLVAVYLLFSDIVAGTLGGQTLRQMRWALSILLSTGAVAGYHWLVYRGERDVVSAQAHGLRYVLLAGVPDRALARDVARALSVHVDAWPATGEATAAAWTVDAVRAALEGATGDEAVVVAEAGALRAIGVDRR